MIFTLSPTLNKEGGGRSGVGGGDEPPGDGGFDSGSYDLFATDGGWTSASALLGSVSPTPAGSDFATSYATGEEREGHGCIVCACVYLCVWCHSSRYSSSARAVVTESVVMLLTLINNVLLTSTLA